MNFIVGLGSNVADRESIITAAIKKLTDTFVNVSVSPVYETPEYGKENGDGCRYCNAVAIGSTDMESGQFVEWLKAREAEAGRTHIAGMEKNIFLDLDLVVWDHMVLRKTDFERPYFNIGYRYLLANGALED